jgi:2-amino-4-hydroxy-6-hydroxymethyldihydropteridine diphosphokinase
VRHLAYIGLGANLPSPVGEPGQTVVAAMDALGGAGSVTARSSLYRTEPVGPVAQGAFVNAALALETKLEPEALLDYLLAVERTYGRDRSRDIPKGPRALDLDLLLVDGLVVNSARLTLPHPALAERRFVLAPLAQIAPGLLHPVSGATMAALLAALPETGPNGRDAVKVLHTGATTNSESSSVGRTP